MRELILMKAVSFLKNSGFTVSTFFDSNSCFDLIARREDLNLVIKVYSNIDGFRKEQAEELQKISKAFNAVVLLIGEKTKAFELKKGVVYERHSVPAMEYHTFVSIFDTAVPSMKFFKGKTIVELDSTELKEKRNELELTLEELAEKTGITKESLYRLEHGFNTSLETAKKLEKLLKADLIVEKNLLEEFVSAMPEKQEKIFAENFDDSALEKIHSLGLDLIEFRHAPFKAFGTKKEFLLIDRGKEKNELKKKALLLEKTKAVFDSHSLIITKKFNLKKISLTPVMEEQELDSYSKINQLLDEIKKREKQGK
ncbi:MAG: helix-turn-helix domain-containing protein [archaeon]